MTEHKKINEHNRNVLIPTTMLYQETIHPFLNKWNIHNSWDCGKQKKFIFQNGTLKFQGFTLGLEG